MASIRFITAPIGGGKTLFSTIQICQELDRTDRFIVTNVPLVLKIVNTPERTLELVRLLGRGAERQRASNEKARQQAEMYWTIAEYCHVFIERPIRVSERLVCLTEEQTLEFWRYIPTGGIDLEEAQKHGLEPFRNESDVRPCTGFKLPNVPHKQYNFVPDFTFRQVHQRGVFYVMDEVHQHFPARFWQTSGPQVERYMSQLRKLNDDLDLITQHPEKVDKNFRRNATDWLQVENMGKKSMFMGVAIKDRFRFHWFNQAEMPTRFEKPTKTGWYSIDPKRRYQWLYKTAEGVGVAGGIVAEESRFKGRHWSVWLLPVPLILIMAYFFPRVVTGTVQKLVGTAAGSLNLGMQRGIQSGLGSSNPPAVAVPPSPSAPAQNPFAGFRPRFLPGFVVGTGVMSASSPPTAAPANSSYVPPPPGIFATGVFQVPGTTNVWVMLSDGTTCKSENGDVQAVGERYVKVNGWPKIPIR